MTNDTDPEDGEFQRDYDSAVRKGRIGRLIVVVAFALVVIGYAALLVGTLM